MERERHWGPLLGLIVVTSAVAPFAALYGDRSRIIKHEKEAGEALRRIGSAEADFHANDRDGNGIQDLWIADVAGLYSIRGRDSRPIALISREIAEADAAPLPENRLTDQPKPYHGYYFQVIRLDTFGVPYASPPHAGVDARHNRCEFGVCAYPAEYGITGRQTFVLDRRFIAFKRDIGGQPVDRFPSDCYVSEDCTWGHD